MIAGYLPSLLRHCPLPVASIYYYMWRKEESTVPVVRTGIRASRLRIYTYIPYSTARRHPREAWRDFGTYFLVSWIQKIWKPAIKRSLIENSSLGLVDSKLQNNWLRALSQFLSQFALTTKVVAISRKRAIRAASEKPLVAYGWFSEWNTAGRETPGRLGDRTDRARARGPERSTRAPVPDRGRRKRRQL